MHPNSLPRATPVALAVVGLLLWGQQPLHAQSNDAEATGAALPAVSVSAPKVREARASIAGLGDAPAWQQPIQAERFSETALKTAQVQRLADLIKLDASVSDAYNATGYWDTMAIRGFTLDNAHNYRREGLPIDTQTTIALDNKEAIEVLKGTSGMQAGTSSPGGLVNYLVKRPQGHVRQLDIAVNDAGNVLTAVDIGERFGANQGMGLRVNAAHERLNTAVANTRGARQLLAVAADWRVAPGTLLEVEMEHSRRDQHSVPGFSMLGNTLPDASSINRQVNINNQAWAEPVVMQGNTGSLRLQQDLDAGWKGVLNYGEQHTKANDRAAFPFAAPECYSDGSNCDRFAADGSFNLLNYRSDGEKRITRALDAQLSGELVTGPIQHKLALGALRTLTSIDVPTAAFTWTGIGHVAADTITPDTYAPDTAQNIRRQRSTELYARDSLQWGPSWRAWAGLRHTQLTRLQYLSDGSDKASLHSEGLITPWLALAYQFAPQQQAYVSWGEGVEVLPPKFNAPFTLPLSNNAEVLPASKSRQWELGIKGQAAHLAWSLNGFYIVRPEANTINHGSYRTYQLDGNTRNKGLEGQLHARASRYHMDLSAMVIDAERRRSQLAGVNGKAPANVPDYSIKLGQGYRFATVQGLSLQGDLVHEGPRTADVVNNVRIPAWTRVDLNLALAQATSGGAITWRLGVVNLFDTQAWRESPVQFDHIYLIPMAGRTVTASAQISY